MWNTWTKIEPIQHCEDFWREISRSPGCAYFLHRCAAVAISSAPCVLGERLDAARERARTNLVPHCRLMDPGRGIFWGRHMLQGREYFVFPEDSVGSPGNALLNQMHQLNTSFLGLSHSSATEPLQYSNPLAVLYAMPGFFWSPVSETTLNMLLKCELKVFVVFIHEVLTAC